MGSFIHLPSWFDPQQKHWTNKLLTLAAIDEVQHHNKTKFVAFFHFNFRQLIHRTYWPIVHRVQIHGEGVLHEV